MWTNEEKGIAWDEQARPEVQHFASADYPELIEGYKTLIMAKLFCCDGGIGRGSVTLDAPFEISFSREENQNILTTVSTKSFENLSFKNNTRYIFVDNKENGDLWNGKFNLSLTIDSNLDDDETNLPIDL